MEETLMLSMQTESTSRHAAGGCCRCARLCFSAFSKERVCLRVFGIAHLCVGNPGNPVSHAPASIVFGFLLSLSFWSLCVCVCVFSCGASLCGSNENEEEVPSRGSHLAKLSGNSFMNGSEELCW